jgi:hypothetical protein
MLPQQEIALKFKRRRFRSNISNYTIHNIKSKDQGNIPLVTGQYSTTGYDKKVSYNTPGEQSYVEEFTTTPTLTTNSLDYSTNMSAIPSIEISSTGSEGRMHFTMEDFLNGDRRKHTRDQLSEEHYRNAERLVSKINKWAELIDYTNGLSSSYRTPREQREIYREQNLGEPAMNSKHLSGHAVDIKDPNGILKQIIRTNIPALLRAKELGLYFENFAKTKTWVHIQDEAPGFTGGQIWAPEDFLYGNQIRYPAPKQKQKRNI